MITKAKRDHDDLYLSIDLDAEPFKPYPKTDEKPFNSSKTAKNIEKSWKIHYQYYNSDKKNHIKPGQNWFHQLFTFKQDLFDS